MRDFMTKNELVFAFSLQTKNDKRVANEFHVYMYRYLFYEAALINYVNQYLIFSVLFSNSNFGQYIKSAKICRNSPTLIFAIYTKLQNIFT